MYNFKGKNIIVTGSEGLLRKNIVKNLQKNSSAKTILNRMAKPKDISGTNIVVDEGWKAI